MGGALAPGCGRIGFDALAGSADSGMITPDVGALGPWRPPTPVTLPIEDDGIGNDDPSLTDDLRLLYWNRSGDTLFVARRAAPDQPWDVLGQDLSLTAASETMPELAGDGLSLYFASTRGGGVGQTDLWSASRASQVDPWTAITHHPDLSSVASEFGGARTADGLILVLSSDRGGDLDLYESTRSATTDPWSTPRAIAAVSTPGREDEPWVSADGRVLYYTGAGPDLYRTERAQVTDPFPAGAPVADLNSAAGDHDAWLSPDERYLMFASDRGGSMQLWEATR